jgi:hypothetical protein
VAGVAALRTRTRPAAQPATQPAAQPATQPAAQPATQPATALVRSIGLAGLVRPASEHTEPAGTPVERMLPVLPELRGLLPGGGMRRGSTVAVRAGVAPGSVSVLLALLAAASAAGSWCAVTGLPDLGAAAAAEIGVALDRLALVPHPGPEWPSVAAALLDGFDLVVTAPPGPVGAAVANRLAARARQRGGVLIPYGRWPGADVVLEPVAGSWSGLGGGRGRLSRRELVIASHGRGAAARPRRTSLHLPRDATAGRPVGPAAPVEITRIPRAAAS